MQSMSATKLGRIAPEKAPVCFARRSTSWVAAPALRLLFASDNALVACVLPWVIPTNTTFACRFTHPNGA